MGDAGPDRGLEFAVAGDAFVEVLGRSGFSDVRAQPLSLGIVYLYLARRT